MAGIAALTQEFLHHATAVLDPSTGQAERRQSDLWLGAFQLSAEAWQVVESVLRAPGVPDNVLFLAAQTLNRKVRYDAEQLRGDWTQVRASLFVLIEAHAARPVVSTQLALGLVACAVQMDSWKGAIADLVRGLEASVGSMLEVLQLIPEEVDEPSLDVSAHRRFSFKNEMIDATSDVIRLLCRFAPTHLKAVLKCATSWVARSDVAGQELAASGILNYAFASLDHPGEFETVVELLIEVVHRYNTLDADDLAVIRVVVPSIFALFPKYERAVAARDHVGTLGLARIFAHMCEAYVDVIVSPQEMDQVSLLRLALAVFSHPDYTVARKCLPFWYEFMDRLKQLDPVEFKEQKAHDFAPVLSQLVTVCCKRMERGPLDEDDEPPQANDDPDNDEPALSEFQEHRLDVSDVLDALLVALPEGDVGPRIAALIEHTSQGQSWQALEAALVAFSSIAKDLTASHRESANGRALSSALVVASQATANAKLRAAACTLTSQCAEFVKRFPEVFLRPAMELAVTSLRFGSLEAQEAAAHTLAVLLSHPPCAQQLGPDFAALATSMGPYDPVLSEGARCVCLEALAYVVSGLPVGGVPALEALAKHPLDVLTRQELGDATQVTRALHALTVLVRYAQPHYVDTRPPVVKLLDAFWPHLDRIHQMLGSSEKVVEAAVRLVKYAMRTHREALRVNVHSLVGFAVRAFHAKPNSGLLYCVGVALNEYAADEGLVDLFEPALTNLVDRSFEVLTSHETFSAHPNFVEDLYYLGNRAVEQIPDKLLPAPTFEKLVAAAARVGVLVEHREAFRSVTIFLENAISLGIVDQNGGGDEFKPFVAAVLERHGEFLMHNLVAGAAGLLSAERVSDPTFNGTVAHVMFVLFEFYGLVDFTASLARALMAPACSHLSNEVRGWLVDRLTQAALSGGRHQFLQTISDFGWKGRRRRRRQVAG